MKKQILLLVFLALTCLSFQPIQKDPDLSGFVKYIAAGYHMPESVKADCHWNYAVVKVFTNKNDVVTRYEVLNYVSQDMNNSFKFLVGYRFNSSVHLHHRPVIFCFSIDNKKQECAVDQYAHSPTEVMTRALSEYGAQHEKDPHAILMYNIIISEIYDTMR